MAKQIIQAGTARTAAQIEADGARPNAAAQQAQLESWLAAHGIKRISRELVDAAILVDEIDAYAADGFMTATRQVAVVLNETITHITDQVTPWPGEAWITHHSYGEQLHRAPDEAERWNTMQRRLRPA